MSTESPLDLFMKLTGATVLIGAFLFLAAIIDGWTLSVIWAWFVMPVFSLPALTIPQAIGLGIVCHHLTHQKQPNCVEKEKTKAEIASDLFAHVVIQPLVCLGVSWVVTFWLP